MSKTKVMPGAKILTFWLKGKMPATYHEESFPMLQQSIMSQRSFGSELRAVGAIAYKEWLIFRRYPSWMLSMFIWPVLFPFGYIFTAKALGGPDGAALNMFRSLTGTADYIGFIVV